MVGLFVPMAAFIMFAVIVGLVTRLIATGMLNKTIREARKTHPEAVPLLVERLDRRPPWGDALLGWTFIALAVAMLLFGLTEPDEDARMEILRSTIVPVVVGTGILVYARFSARSLPRPDAAREMAGK